MTSFTFTHSITVFLTYFFRLTFNIILQVISQTTDGTGTNETHVSVWPVSRSSLQDLILFLVGNCVVRQHAQISLKKEWSIRSKEFRLTDEEEEELIEKEKEKKKKLKKNKSKKGVALPDVDQNDVVLPPARWYLSDIPKMIVEHSSIRTRLITISILSEFARDTNGRTVFVNDDRIVGQICDMSMWAIEWLASVCNEDVDVNSDTCLREPVLEDDESMELVYQILEHCALSLWGWAMCACEMMLGNQGEDGEDEDEGFERQMKAMGAMTSMADSMSNHSSSRPTSKKSSSRPNTRGGVMTNLAKGLKGKDAKPTAMEVAMLRVPGILTTMAGMSNGLLLRILLPTNNETKIESENEMAPATPKSNTKNSTKKNGNRSRAPSSPSRNQDVTSNNNSNVLEIGIHLRMNHYNVQENHHDNDKEEIGWKFLCSEKYPARVARIESLGAGCISTIATVKQMAGAILKNGIVKILLKLLFSNATDSNECRECAASALCLFAQGSVEGRKEIYTRGGVEALLNVVAPIIQKEEKSNKKSKGKNRQKKKEQKEQQEQKEQNENKYNYAQNRASTKLLGFCTEILHREAYLLDDVVMQPSVVSQLVHALESVKAPVLYNEETNELEASTEQDPDEDWIFQTHIACTIWRVGIHPINCETLGEVGVCAVLARVIEPLIVTNAAHTYDLMSNRILEQRRVSLLDFTVLSLWILAYNENNCKRMEIDGKYSKRRSEQM